MSYSKQTWSDNNVAYPVSAGRMGHIEDGIESVSNAADAAQTTANAAQSDLADLKSVSINAKDDFGATGGGSVDDTSAIQAAIDHAQSINGATVFFPDGNYLINGRLNLAANAPVRLVGTGIQMNQSGAPWGAGTIFSRNASWSAPGSGTNAMIWGDHAFVGIENITFHGGTKAGMGLALDNSFVTLDNLRWTSFLHTALQLRSIYNTAFSNLWFVQCGNGTALPTTLLSSAPGNGPGTGCATLHFVNCEWESNRGTDLKLTGNTGAGVESPCDDIQFTNVKMEGGATGFSEPCPYIDLAYAQNCSFTNMNVTAHTGRNVALIQENRPFATGRSNKFSQTYLQNSDNSTFDYFMKLTKGCWQLSNVGFEPATNGPSSGSAIRLESTVSTGHFQSSSLFNGTISDARSAPSVAAATTTTLPYGERLVTITAGAGSITSITAQERGAVVTLLFGTAVSMVDGSNLKLAGNFSATSGDTLSLISDGPNWVETGRSDNAP
jgi:hypothetical protein